MHLANGLTGLRLRYVIIYNILFVFRYIILAARFSLWTPLTPVDTTIIFASG